MEFTTRTLQRHERDEYARHLILLDDEGRRLRFASPRGDDAIREYVQKIDLAQDAIIGVYDADLTLIGAAHVARGPGYAEVGVSVLRGHRGRGVGSALLSRSRLHARNLGVAELFTHCAADNRAMMMLARKHGMRSVVERGEADSYIEVPAPDASSYTAELLAERVGTLDHAMKRHLLDSRRMASAFLPLYKLT